MARFTLPIEMTRWEWLVQRFWLGIDKRGPNDCWPWTKAKVTDGYGTIAYGFGKIYATHRLAYILANGEIPDKLQILHKCDNPSCCNPTHLFLGTNLDNIKDMIVKKRGSVKLTKKQVEEIKLDCRKQKFIAYEYGITQSMVSRIKKGSRWHEW